MTSIAFEKMMRHAQATAHSDYQHLKQCLFDASNRFADIATQIEKDGGDAGTIAFARASAERYKGEAEAH